MTEAIHHLLEQIDLKDTNIDINDYKKLYHYSIDHPVAFWEALAQKKLSWIKPWHRTLSGNFLEGNIRWFEGGKLNATYNCLDRHLPKLSDKTALIWEGDDPSQSKKLSYQDLFEAVCRLSHILKSNGIKKGDRVCLYLPMIPELIIAMLAIARIGAIHCVVFAGFSAESLKLRIQETESKMLITADVSFRGGKEIDLKSIADEALTDVTSIQKVIVVKQKKSTLPWQKDRDLCYQEEMDKAKLDTSIEVMDANDPLFILYTSGSTGKPKGILHAIGGYLLYVATTFQWIFNYQADQVFWCTADIGWITGHSYLVYGPLLNGATILLYEGTPTYPNPGRYFEIIDKHQVNIFYTAPTALRMLRKEGNDWPAKYKLSSLKLLGSVGEPIDPEVWQWYYDIIGQKKCPIVDTWWQTETGGILISPIPRVTPLKPGSAAWPFLGTKAEIVDEEGKKLTNKKMGKLVLSQAWPGMMQTIYKDHDRFMNAYFKPIPGVYLTGDQAYQDEDGYFWILGRDDDVIKVAGHRIGTQEVESALLQHDFVAEAAVVPIPDPIKGQKIFAYVTLKNNRKPNATLKKELVDLVRQKIGPFAQVSKIKWVENLPKTRSGKIMRRLLRKIANNETTDLGDLSTLADPSVIKTLMNNKKGED